MSNFIKVVDISQLDCIEEFNKARWMCIDYPKDTDSEEIMHPGRIYYGLEDANLDRVGTYEFVRSFCKNGKFIRKKISFSVISIEN